MKVLVIPDIHLKPWIFDKVEVILNKYKIDKANRIDKKEKITRLIIDSDDILILRFIFDFNMNKKYLL